MYCLHTLAASYAEENIFQYNLHTEYSLSTPYIPENSISVTINTPIQVKVIIKVIYINVDHDMFRSLLGHHQVYLCVFRCWFLFFKYGPIFSSYLTIRLCDYCLVLNLWFVYSLALSYIGIKLKLKEFYYYTKCIWVRIKLSSDVFMNKIVRVGCPCLFDHSNSNWLFLSWFVFCIVGMM
jgi:hypothetical protein